MDAAAVRVVGLEVTIPMIQAADLTINGVRVERFRMTIDGGVYDERPVIAQVWQQWSGINAFLRPLYGEHDPHVIRRIGGHGIRAVWSAGTLDDSGAAPVRLGLYDASGISIEAICA